MHKYEARSVTREDFITDPEQLESFLLACSVAQFPGKESNITVAMEILSRAMLLIQDQYNIVPDVE